LLKACGREEEMKCRAERKRGSGWGQMPWESRRCRRAQETGALAPADAHRGSRLRQRLRRAKLSHEGSRSGWEEAWVSVPNRCSPQPLHLPQPLHPSSLHCGESLADQGGSRGCSHTRYSASEVTDEEL
jgi:hypothetical protein